MHHWLREVDAPGQTMAATLLICHTTYSDAITFTLSRQILCDWYN